ncbi:sugar ABC transporter ATP-binding protein [Paraconexibacter antarcticus]|uniref:Sugar ABC transporter ATP-binding protein n=1 Tax=Paraconexibacter antarcticus TaxID=2949664 RepID=A0ABY5DKS6_9ACTN|nr:sugar ABC transporter ATP-binding protein [Paraconexibacter antarcticus]UTI62345.1 sugar ABC transporter ATP-binding protein [Paraconexibacter antarcticus]
MSPLAESAVATAPWIVCRAVEKHYAGVRALAGADLDLRPGEVHGLIGPNGAGKSTLVKVLTGVVQRDGGEVLVDGEEVHLRTPVDASERGLILMPQEIAIVPAASVIDNINLGAEPTRRGLRWDAQCRREAAAALAVLDLDIDPEANAGTLSAAHQRMLMMARAVHRKARLLILDEPTAGLATHEAELVGGAVRRLAGGELTIVFVSHHLSEVAKLSDRVSCVREGRVVETLERDELSKDRLVELLTGVPRGVAIPAAAETAEAVPAAAAAAGGGLELRGAGGARTRGVDLHAPRGQVTGITGLLGSGVTELVGFLVGAQAPADGEVVLGGEPLALRSPADALRRSIGYLPGDRTKAAFATMSIRSNVSIGALDSWFGRFGLLRNAKEESGVAAALSVLSVEGDAQRPISVLSGGNQQRALVARLLAADARILVLDEPTVGVDVRARAELWGAVRELAHDRVVVVASSEPDELVALCDRVVCIRDGRVAAVLEGDRVTEAAIAGAIA